MPANTIDDLRDALGIGLSMVTRIWEFKTKDWVTSVFASDIDNDGEVEVVVCSRDGRVHLLTNSGDCRWEHIVGRKAWIGTGVVGDYLTGSRIVVGTRDGGVYILDKDGKALPEKNNASPLNDISRVIDTGAEKEAYWHHTGYVISQIHIDPEHPSTIIIGSEDRCTYGLDYESGVQLWQFQTNGQVHAVFSCDINCDGNTEILLGSLDNYLYLLDAQGQLLAKYNMKFSIHTLYATDVDKDGQVEILVGTDGKDLTALTFDADCGFAEKWRHPFDNRLLSLCVTDIDGDGQSEIIAGSEDKHFYILDAQGKVIWRHNHKHRAFSIYPYDIDNDGVPELLVGSDNNIVRAMRIRLRRGVDKKIRRYYKSLKEHDAARLAELTINERNLLQDILLKSTKEYVNLKQAEDLIGEKLYKDALSILLRLEQQKVESHWNRNAIGHIRTVCFRQVSGDLKQEIIVGTIEGNVMALNASGRNLWSTHLDDRIVDVQTGFIDHHRQEEIVICSSDHHVYILEGTKKRERRKFHIDTYMLSICVAAPNKRSQAEIIIGSEDKKLYIYGSDLQVPLETINTSEGIRVVRTYSPGEDHSAEIVAGSLDNHVNTYTRNGKSLWNYETRDHIRAICLKDINGDAKAEVLVGSEDRNLHVLDSSGHLLWRYFLPHSILSVDAADVDHDSRFEIFVGCADGYLYVFNREGDFLWKYQASDRIQAVRVEDIDDDGQVEIVIGSEDELELLQLVNQRNVQHLIDQCWSVLCQEQPSWHTLNELLYGSDPYLQSFALGKLADLDSFSSSDFSILEQFAKESLVDVRKMLVRVTLEHYQISPVRARLILQWLSTDPEQEVRSTFIEYLPALMKHDWELGFLYLKRFSENDNRYVRRLVVRKLHQLIDLPVEITMERQRKIFDLLLAAAQNKELEWVCQETARTLAHFLDRYHGGLIVNVQMFIVKDIQHKILLHIVYTAKSSVVKHYLNAVIPMLGGLTDENMLERTQQLVYALEEATGLDFSRDVRTIYAELCRLLVLRTIAEIAQYQCSLNENQFAADNKFARIILDIFEKLSSISRVLRIYLRREGLPDRLSGLLEAITAIDKVIKYLERPYSLSLLGEPITKLPDHTVFILLFQRWREMVLAKLNELRGKAEFRAELQAKHTRYEDQVGIWLIVRNKGRSSANDVQITLLHNDDFPVVGNSSTEFETILPQEDITVEFIVKPRITSLDLRFEIAYSDAEKPLKVDEFEDHLELSETLQEFRYIPNSYSTGAPTHDKRMFYGRETDLAFLQDNLTRDAKTVIVLYGQRRSGKTTLLLQLINTFALGEHIPVLIDMQRVSYNINIHNFLFRVAHFITQAMKKNGIFVCEPKPEDFDIDPIYTFDVFLDNIGEQLAERKLILLIDEFEVLEEQVIRGKLEPEIFEYLRDILQHRQNVNFLFSGTHKITEYTKWYRSVFFNIARHHRLSQLNPQGAEDLIQQPVAGLSRIRAVNRDKDSPVDVRSALSYSI